MKKKTKMLMVLFLVFTLLGIWNNIAISQEDMMVTPIMGFPEATITIFPIVLNMTGPVGKNSQYREFTDRYMHAFRERVNSEILGRLLEEKGYDKFEVSDAKFQFPMDSTEREKRAAIFGKFVREVELKTDYALGIEFTLHIENSWQEVYWVITD
jgi:hypothetical protein